VKQFELAGKRPGSDVANGRLVNFGEFSPWDFNVGRAVGI
jgi:hypothetical protein